MIQETVVSVLKKIGHVWRLENKAGLVYSGPKFYAPEEEDVTRVLDTAVEQLYDGPEGQRLSAPGLGLIIEKAQDGYDVYVYTGNYKGEK